MCSAAAPRGPAGAVDRQRALAGAAARVGAVEHRQMLGFQMGCASKVMAPQQKLLAASISPRAKPLAFRLPPSLPDPGCVKTRTTGRQSINFSRFSPVFRHYRLGEAKKFAPQAPISDNFRVFTQPGPIAVIDV